LALPLPRVATDFSVGLDALYGAGAGFRSQASRSIFDDRSKEVIVVLPTGGGKSHFYMLGSFLDDGLFTLVVIPLRALIYDVGRQLDRHHIGYEEWTRDSEGFGQKVVLLVQTLSQDLSSGPN